MTDPTLLVLASLAEGEKHGYAIMTDVEGFAGVRLGPGTLYGAIARLEEHGWIEPVAPRERRQPYRITRLGRERLRDDIASLNRIVRAAHRRLGNA
jgi:DNA-binding PadR family transcriptional regulator